MVVFGLAMVVFVAWLIYGGVAGKQRGLSFKNLTTADVVLRLDDGRSVRLAPQAEQTLPVKPGQFPQNFTVTDADGNELYHRRFDFPEFKNYEFRIGIGSDQFVVYKGIDSPGTY